MSHRDFFYLPPQTCFSPGFAFSVDGIAGDLSTEAENLQTLLVLTLRDIAKLSSSSPLSDPKWLPCLAWMAAGVTQPAPRPAGPQNTSMDSSVLLQPPPCPEWDSRHLPHPPVPACSAISGLQPPASFSPGTRFALSHLFAVAVLFTQNPPFLAFHRPPSSLPSHLSLNCCLLRDYPLPPQPSPSSQHFFLCSTSHQGNSLYLFTDCYGLNCISPKLIG